MQAILVAEALVLSPSLRKQILVTVQNSKKDFSLIENLAVVVKLHCFMALRNLVRINCVRRSI